MLFRSFFLIPLPFCLTETVFAVFFLHLPNTIGLSPNTLEVSGEACFRGLVLPFTIDLGDARLDARCVQLVLLPLNHTPSTAAAISPPAKVASTFVTTQAVWRFFHNPQTPSALAQPLREFVQHQLCWANFLHKAAELMLRNPDNKSYRRFYVQLMLLYRLAKCYQKDGRLSVGRAAKVKELQEKVKKLCKRYQEEIITEEDVKNRNLGNSLITSDSDAKLIRLQNELVDHLENLFVFVEHPEVGSTNNQSERNLRGEAIARKASKTSRSERGAERRGIIISVLGTLKRRLKEFSLESILKYVEESYRLGVSLLSLIKSPETQ
jgi:hypothetical protein